MIFLALICGALLLALFAQARVFNAERRDWMKERQLLVTRIQHPEIVPIPEQERVVENLPEQEPDEIDLIGTVVDNGHDPS